MDSDDLFDSKALEEAKKLPRGKGREMFTYLSPEEFLSLTPSLEPRVEKSKGINDAIRSGQKLKDIPFLSIDEAGKVIGHEGRHRAMVIANMGMKRIPVVLRSKNVRWNAQADPNSFDYINKLPRLITPQKGAADPAASVRAPYRASGPSRGLVRNERATGAISMAKRVDPDLREYEQMTETLRQPGGPLARTFPRSSSDSPVDRLNKNIKRSGLYGNQDLSDNFKRVQAAQAAIGGIQTGPGFSDTAAENLLRSAGIQVDSMRGKAPMAIHPLTGRRVSAVALASEIDSIAKEFPDMGSLRENFRLAAGTLKTGDLPPEVVARMAFDDDVGLAETLDREYAASEQRRLSQEAIGQARGEAADTHLKRNLRNFKQRQRVAADIADPSVMQRIKEGIGKADTVENRRLAATALRGTGRLAGGALGLAGSMPADIALRAMGRPDDMTVTEDYRQDEALAADVLGLAQRSEMPVYSLSPERKAAAMMAIRSGRSGLRPPPVDGVIQDAITDEEIQFLLRGMADPGNPTVSRPRYEAPKAAPRSNELK